MSRKNKNKEPTIIDSDLPTDATAKLSESQTTPPEDPDKLAVQKFIDPDLAKPWKGPEDVDPAAIDRERKFVVIMGHPRSGTCYMAALLRAFGYDVAHESDMGADGISSWLFAGCDNPRWGPDPWNYEFENRIHVVRHPLKVLSSVLQCVEQGVQEIMAREAGIDPEMPAPRRVVKVYLRWHERIVCRKPNLRMKVEDAPEAIAGWLKRDPDPDKLPPTDLNRRKDKVGGLELPDFPIEFWQAEVKYSTLVNLVELAREYGYFLANGEEETK